MLARTCPSKDAYDYAHTRTFRMLKQVLDMEAKYLQDIHGKGDSHQGGMDASSNNFDDEMIPDHMRNPYGGMPGVPMYINKSIM